MIKVAIIEPVGGHGGMNYYDFGLAAGLSASGIAVTVYTCDRTDVPVDLPFKVERTFRKIWGGDHKWLRACRFVLCMFRTLMNARSNRIGLVHFHFFHYTPIEALSVAMARLFGFKIVITAHDVESFTGNHSIGLARRIFAGADRVIAHNRVSKKELTEKVGVAHNKIAVIPHGNYLDSVPGDPSRDSARKQLNLPLHSPVILFFGQIKQVKGLDLILEALPGVLEKIPALKLVIAGKVWKDDFDTYEKMIRENNLQDHVDPHIRYIPDDEAPCFYRAADLVILPYRRIYQSGVLLMAMSYGIPVLVSDLDGMVEIIEADRNGYSFTANSSENLGRQIIHALSDPEKRKRMSLAGLETIRRDYSWRAIGQQTASIYQSL